MCISSWYGYVVYHNGLFPAKSEFSFMTSSLASQEDEKIWEKSSPIWRKPQFRSLYTVSTVIDTKAVIGWFKLQLKMWLVDLNYNFECNWLIELSDNELSDNNLSDNNLTSVLVEITSFFNQSQWRKL